MERSLGQTHLLILESLLERQEETGAHPRDINTGSSHCSELNLPQDTDAASVFFKNPSSSLLVPGVSPTHQAFDTNNGTPQAKQLPRVGHSTTYQQTGYPQSPEPLLDKALPLEGPGLVPTLQCTGTRPGTPRDPRVQGRTQINKIR